MPAKNKHSSLLQTIVNYVRKKRFKTLATGPILYTFYDRNLRIFIISKTVCRYPRVEHLKGALLD
jgi:hypothetical protein